MQDKTKYKVWQEKFDGFEAEPANDLWAGIESQIHPKSKVNIPLWVYGLAASIVLFLTLFVLLWPKNQGLNENKILVHEPEVEEEILYENPEQDIVAEESVPEKSETVSAPVVKQQKKQEVMISQPVQEPESEMLVIASPETQKVPPKFIETEPVMDQEWANSEGQATETKINIDEILASGESLDNMSPILPTINEISINESSNDQLGLNQVKAKDILAMAADGLNRLMNEPVDIAHKQEKNEEVTTVRFSFANFSFSKTKHKKKIKQ